MAKKIARGGPCSVCREPGDCENCLDSPQNSIPVKLYTPKGAARAMLTGKVLTDRHGWRFFWEERGEGVGFWFQDESGDTFTLQDFSDLWEEL